MATNVEILGNLAANIIPLSRTDELKHLQTVTDDAEIIVKDILGDIFDAAIRKSEESHEINSDEKKNSTENIETETSDLIDLTRNYKQEFRTILQNLKCHSHKSEPSSNASLEDQIKKVIEEIKSLETSVRLNIHHEGRGDIEIMSDDNQTSNSSPIDIKSGITDFLNDCTNGKKQQDVYTDEDLNDEVVLQVINLQPEDSEVSSFTNQFPSEDSLEDVNLNEDNSLNQGDRPQTLIITNILPNAIPCAGETAVPNPVPEPEPDEKLLRPEDGTVRKKKGLGKRLWNFLKKNPRSTAHNSVARKLNDTTL